MESFYKAQGKIDADREILAEKRKEKNRLKNLYCFQKMGRNRYYVFDIDLS